MPSPSAFAARAPARAAKPALPSFRSVFHDALDQQLLRRSDGIADVRRSPPEVWLRAAAAVCMGELERRWAATQAEDLALLTRKRAPGKGQPPARRVHYLSMEFLMGRALGNALAALGLDEEFRRHLAASKLAPADVLECERDAALGNGGLGRLAACFLDSFATLGLPSFGYGPRYEYGMFAQKIVDGAQVEEPDDWLRGGGSAWEVRRPELRFEVGFGGRVEAVDGRRRWQPAKTVFANAYDLIVPGHGTERVSTLRQWRARATGSIDFELFCRGEHVEAGRERIEADLLNWVLYPDDSTPAGRELRLKQEHFLVSASLQDILQRHLREQGRIDNFGDKNVIHLNDTHPALAPVELMRLLVDVHGLDWDTAWAQTHKAVSYTNHTLLPEALETWPVWMFESLLPRHLEIVYQINHQFLDEVRRRHPHDHDLLRRVSLIDESGERRVRMAALSIVAAHRVNGVSELHSHLMVQSIFADFARLFPERFTNVTNGVTPRRWLMQANPGLASLIDDTLGGAWRRDLDRLHKLAAHAQDRSVGRALAKVKRANKLRLAALIERELGVRVDPDSLFDVQVKRVHEYKRQLLNLMHVVARYHAMLADPDADWVPRTVILSGKAASAYRAAKSIVRLAHDVAAVVNADARLRDRLKVVFLPNYSVSLAEVVIPAADLSQQISTAGLEASGTGNMKFALNGALTIGTWDGANIEMAQAIGEEHLFVFGLRAEEIAQRRLEGYQPRAHYGDDARLRGVVDALLRGDFSPGDAGRYRSLIEPLLEHDRYMLMADFDDYLRAQREVDALYRQPALWAEKALRNVAGMGRFSSDRTIVDYVARIWSHVP